MEHSPPRRVFEQELLTHTAALKKHAATLTRDRHEAQDLVQEALTRALQNWHRFVVGTNMGAWVCTILHHVFLDSVRRHDHKMVIRGNAAGHLIGLCTVEPDYDSPTQLRQVVKKIDRLPQRQRESIALIATEHSYDQAAKIMGVHTGTVKTHVSVARAELREFAGQERWSRK